MCDGLAGNMLGGKLGAEVNTREENGSEMKRK